MTMRTYRDIRWGFTGVLMPDAIPNPSTAKIDEIGAE